MDIWKEEDIRKILSVVEKSPEPLETKEIQKQLASITRTKILYRLLHLKADSLIKGKQVGPGKGCWIWWKK